MQDTKEILEKVNKDNRPYCKICGSSNVVKHGEIKGIQRYRCKNCGRTFLDNINLPDMKTPKVVIAGTLNMYYEGISINTIRRHCELMLNVCPSVSTLYGCLTKYSQIAIEDAKAYTPNVSDVWVADETTLKIGGQTFWLWDMIDVKTRFLLASHLSTVCNTNEALTLMKQAEQRAGKAPELVFTDKLKAYLDGIELAWGANSKHIPTTDFEALLNTNIPGKLHSTIKEHATVIRGLRNLQSAKLFMNGWLVHYNFFRPNEELCHRTPAEKAGIKFHFNNWGDVVMNIDAISTSVASIAGDTATIVGEWGTMQASLDSLNATLESVDGNVATIVTDLGTVQASLDDLNATVTSIDGNVATVTTDVGVIKGNVASIDGNVATITTDIGTMEANIALMTEDIDTVASNSKWWMPIMILTIVALVVLIIGVVVGIIAAQRRKLLWS